MPLTILRPAPAEQAVPLIVLVFPTHAGQTLVAAFKALQAVQAVATTGSFLLPPVAPALSIPVPTAALQAKHTIVVAR